MNKYIALLPALLPVTLLYGHTTKQLQSHEIWWTINTEREAQTLDEWLGDVQAKSRVYMRTYLKTTDYKNILDVPCGTCIDFRALQAEQSQIAYVGLDITATMVNKAHLLGAQAFQGSIEAIPFSDATFDIVYARHVLEHLTYYKKALLEAIRVGKKEVLIIFFRVPTQEPDEIQFTKDRDAYLYHNRYNKECLETFILAQPKVASAQWYYLGKDQIGEECALHILLKEVYEVY